MKTRLIGSGSNLKMEWDFFDSFLKVISCCDRNLKKNYNENVN